MIQYNRLLLNFFQQVFYVAKAKRQLQVFDVAKAKRQLQVFDVVKAKRQHNNYAEA